MPSQLNALHRWFRKLTPAMITGLVAVLYRAAQALHYLPPDERIFPFLVLLAWVLFLYWAFGGPWAVRVYEKFWLRFSERRRWVPYLTVSVVGVAIVASTGAGWWRLFNLHRRQMAALTATTSQKEEIPFGERPYVLAEDVQFVDDENKVEIRYHNSGGTPAIDLGLSSRYAITDSGFNLNEVKPEDLSQPSGYGNVAAGMWIANRLDTQKLEHAPEFNAMRQGQLRGYVFGFLRYKDLKGASYEPRFCFVWSPQDSAFVRCPANAFVQGQKLAETPSSIFLGVHKPSETLTIPPHSHAIIGTNVSATDVENVNKKLAAQDSAKKHLEVEPDNLSLYDLFLTDFSSAERRYQTGFTLRNDQTVVQTHLEWAVISNIESGSELIMLYVPFTNETVGLCTDFLKRYKKALAEAQLFETTQKGPGDSEKVSSKSLVFSNRVFIYHENDLSGEETAVLETAYKSAGLTLILRSTGYLQTKKLEAKLKKLQK